MLNPIGFLLIWASTLTTGKTDMVSVVSNKLQSSLEPSLLIMKLESNISFLTT